MEYSNEVLKQMIQFGTLGYPLSKIINIIEVDDIDQFKHDFNNIDSEIAKQYQKGVDRSDFFIDSKLFELAKNGDLRAIDMITKRKLSNTLKKQAESLASNKK